MIGEDELLRDYGGINRIQGDWEQLAREDVETMLDPGGTDGEHAHDLRM